MPTISTVHVAAAAIVNDSNEVLIARRPEHAHQGGLWEFPGGKVEDGESVLQALHRELYEEIGIETLESRPLIRLHYDYPDKSVLLDVWLVTRFSGAPHGREGQPVRWVPRASLSSYDYPAANRPIVTALQLPNRYLITPSPGNNWDNFFEGLTNSLRTGITLVQLRAPELAAADYVALAKESLQLCRQYDATLLLNGEPQWVDSVGAHGVHLNSRRLRALSGRPLPSDLWVAASCHNAQEISQANGINVDFAVLAPVLATQSHPQAVPLGWEAMRRLTDAANFPVYALGGMTPDHLPLAFEHGGQGIAAIRGLWGGDCEFRD